MNATSQITSSGSSILSSLDAVRNMRALWLVFGSLALSAVAFGIGAALANVSVILLLLFALVGALVAFYGLSAAGIVLMDEKKGLRTTPRDALTQSLFTSHRLLLVGLMVGLLYLAGMLMILLALAVCKIPILGPVLYTVVFPVSVVVCGVALVALYFVVGPLAAPAVWDGATTMQVVSRLFAIARSRLLNVLLMMLLLTLLCGVVGAIVGFVIFGGTLVTAGLSTPVLGASSLMSGMNPNSLYAMGGGLGSYMTAAMIGGGVLYALAFSLPALIYVQGCCAVYLENLKGVDVAGMEREMKSRIDGARAKAEALREQQRRATAMREAKNEEARADREAAQSAGAAPISKGPAAGLAVTPLVSASDSAPRASVEPLVSLRCPECGAPHLQYDKFCGGCGQKLL